MVAPVIPDLPGYPSPNDPDHAKFNREAYEFSASLQPFAANLNAFGSYIGTDIDVTKTLRTPEDLAALPDAATRGNSFLFFTPEGDPATINTEAAFALLADVSDEQLAASNNIVLNGIDADANSVRVALNVADGATANDTNASLRARSTHTGFQSISTITGLQSALDAKEILANKKASLVSPNNNDFPTTLAVASAISTAMAGETPKGAWNASTNTPALASSVGTAGNWYEVSVSGTTDLNGEIGWQVGDKAIFNGIIWTRIPANSVRSVDGRTGAVISNFDTVAAAEAVSLPVGAKYSTKGAATIGDGFGGDYLVFSSSSVAADEFNVIAHADGKFGIRQPVKNYYLYSKSVIGSRAPTRSDFKDMGLPSLNTWSCDDGVYYTNRVGSNYATWIKDRTFIPIIGDIIAPEAIWWNSKVVSAYAGQCINVTNEALGTSADIGFDAGGNLDTNKIDNFLRSSRGLVNTWYDQSGNGHDLTSTGANRPIISSVAKVGNLRAIIFETGVIYNGAVTPNQFMTIPNTLAGESNNVSMACLCSLASSLRDAPIVELPGADGNYTAIGKRNASGSSGFNVYQNSSLRVNSQHQPKISDNFFFASIGASAINYWGNDTISVTGTALASSAWTGGKVGGTTNLFVNGVSVAQNGGAIMAGLAIYKTSTTVGLQRLYHRSVVKNYNIVPQLRANIVFDGDSITEGAGADYFDNTSVVVNERLLYGARIHNVAQSGGTIDTQDANRTHWETQIYRPNAPLNLIVLAIGTNNLLASESAASVYAKIQTYVAAVKSTGYEVVISSILPRQSFISTAKETERLALNQLLKDNWRSDGAIGYINYDNEGTMGSNTFVTDTYYYSDGTHPTTAGYALLATYVSYVIEPIIGRLISRS